MTENKLVRTGLVEETAMNSCGANRSIIAVAHRLFVDPLVSVLCRSMSLLRLRHPTDTLWSSHCSTSVDEGEGEGHAMHSRPTQRKYYNAHENRRKAICSTGSAGVKVV